MPAPGTKKIIIDGRETYAPAEDVDLAEAIAVGLALQEDVARAKAKLDEHKAATLAKLTARMGERKSITVEGLLGGKVKVSGGEDVKVIDAHVDLLRVTIDPEPFNKLFVASWKRTRGHGKAKAAIADLGTRALVEACLKVTPKNASIKFLGTEETEVDDDEE